MAIRYENQRTDRVVSVPEPAKGDSERDKARKARLIARLDASRKWERTNKAERAATPKDKRKPRARLTATEAASETEAQAETGS